MTTTTSTSTQHVVNAEDPRTRDSTTQRCWPGTNSQKHPHNGCTSIYTNVQNISLYTC